MPAAMARGPRVLSVIPPMTQLNTPYPSTAYLTGFLRSRGVEAVQEDLALALVLELFSPDGLRADPRMRTEACPPKKRRPALAQASSNEFDRYRATIDRRHRLPAGPRPDAGAPHRQPQLPARGAALRLARRLRRRGGRRPAGLGLRRARRAGPRAPPGHAVPQRPRRRAARRGRPALRVRALRRVAGAEPAELRPAWRRRWPRRRTWSTARCAS